MGTSFTYGSYGTNSPAPSTNTFQLTSSSAAGLGRVVEWYQDNSNRGFATAATGGTAGVTYNTPNSALNTATPMQAVVTLTFTREVSSLSFVMQDIDRNTGFTDEMAFYALNTAGTRVDLATGDVTLGSNSTNSFIDNITIDGVTQDAIRGINSNTSRNGNVTITFPSPVKTLRLSYRNLNTTSGNPGGRDSDPGHGHRANFVVRAG